MQLFILSYIFPLLWYFGFLTCKKKKNDTVSSFLCPFYPQLLISEDVAALFILSTYNSILNKVNFVPQSKKTLLTCSAAIVI